MIVGDEGTTISIGLLRPSKGEYTVTITRGSTSSSSGAASSAPKPSAAPTAPVAGDYSSWSVKDLKQALSEAGINHMWANEKSELVTLASEARVPPPGTKRQSASSGSGARGEAALCLVPVHSRASMHDSVILFWLLVSFSARSPVPDRRRFVKRRIGRLLWRFQRGGGRRGGGLRL